jgi:tetratricopeptide (TPR) repeat protein
VASTEQEQTSRTRPAWIEPVVVGFLALTAHCASLACGWIWDDDSYVTANRVVQSIDGLFTLWVPGQTPQYYPLVFLGFWLQHFVFGLEPFSYHLINVLMHAANATLLLLVLTRAKVPYAFWIAALFAVHPMGVESVAWVTERKNVQSMLFALSSALCFLKMLEAQQGSRASYWILSFLCFVAALLSKTTAIFVPPCLVMIALWNRRAIDWRLVLAVSPYFAVGLGLGLFTAIMEKTHVGASGEAFALSLPERLQLAGRTATFYLATFALPREQIFIYPRFELDASDWALWIPTILWAAAFVVAGMLWRTTRAPLLVLLWIGAGLFPALGFFNVWPFIYSFVADHFAYAAMPAFALVAVTCAIRIGELVPRIAGAGRLIGGLVVAACIVLSILATPKYESEEVLWRTTFEQNPKAWIAANNIASILLPRAGGLAEAGRTEEATVIAREALVFARAAGEVNPGEFTNAVNRSEAHRLLGEKEDALREIEYAAKLAPRISDVHWLRGRVLESLGRADEARAAFKEAAALATKVREEISARRELLRLSAARRDLDDAITQCTRLIDLNPEDAADMRANLGSLLMAAGRDDEARRALREAARLPINRFSRETVWITTAAAYLRLAINADISSSEAGDARGVAARLVSVSRGDPAARYLQLALALTLGDEAARVQLERIATDARAAGATQLADEVSGFLARHRSASPASR